MTIKRVVVVLPVAGNRVLLQLRDMKEGIDFPGHWGFFGGGINCGETAEQAAQREIFEEIGFRPEILHQLHQEKIPDLESIYAFSYGCRLTVPLESLALMEGLDFGMKSLEEVRTGRIYSDKMKADFPTVPSQFVERSMRKALNLLS